MPPGTPSPPTASNLQILFAGGAVPINLSRAGVQLCHTLWSLPACSMIQEGAWVDVHCDTLAEALVLWSGGDMRKALLLDPAGHPHHVMAKLSLPGLPPVYADGRGFGVVADAAHTLRFDQGILTSSIITHYDPDIARRAGIAPDEAVVGRLVSVITEGLGPYDREALHADIEETLTRPPQLAFHVTPAEHLVDILRHGLLPAIGPRSQHLECDPAVYAFPDVHSLDDGLGNWLGDAFDDVPEDGLVVIAIQRDKCALGPSGTEFELVSTAPIPREAIHQVLSERGFPVLPPYPGRDDLADRSVVYETLSSYGVALPSSGPAPGY